MRYGSTLLEFVASLTIFGLLIVGMQSSVAVAVKSIPSSSSPISLQSRAQSAMECMLVDLQSALFVSELTSNSIAFTVPDRNGDKRSERLRYAWSGLAGAPLTRQINGGPAAIVIPSVYSCSLTPQFESETISYPSVAVEDAAESLLIDYSQVVQPLEHDVTSSLAIGQRLALDLPSNAYAWRPTRIQFPARYASLLGAAAVQLRSNGSSYSPGTDVWQQQFISWLTLAANYTWHSFSFADVEPLPSGGSFSLVLQRSLGSRAVTLLSSDSNHGLLKGSGNGSVWELQDGRGLVCQVFGKLWRSTETRTLTIKKVAAVEIDLRTTQALPVLHYNVALLNKPDVLTNEWSLDFTSDPTQVDTNGNGQSDWALTRPGTISPASLSASGWITNGDQLISNQDCSFQTATLIEFSAQSLAATDEGAVVSLNLLRTGGNCVPLTVRVKKMPDGTQSVWLQVRTSESRTSTLLNLSRQPNQSIQVKLIVDPVVSAVAVFVGEVAYGTFAMVPYASSQTSQRITLGASGGAALIRSFRVRSL